MVRFVLLIPWKELQNEVDASKNEDQALSMSNIETEINKVVDAQNRGKTLSGLKVTVRGDDLNGALRVLKKRMQTEGVFNELRERTAFRSRGEKRDFNELLVEEDG